MKNKSQVGVIFDLDNTITCNDTYLHFLLSFLKQNPSRLLRCWSLPLALICFKIKIRDNTWLKKKFLGAIAGGTSKNKIEAFSTQFIKAVVEQKVRGKALQEIQHHKQSGHRLILATASFDFYVEELGSRLGFDTVLCTKSVWDNNLLQAEISGDNCYGMSKLNKVIYYVESNFDIAYTIAYSDHHSDIPLLDWADEAIAINPTNKLRELATQKKYKIINW